MTADLSFELWLTSKLCASTLHPRARVLRPQLHAERPRGAVAVAHSVFEIYSIKFVMRGWFIQRTVRIRVSALGLAPRARPRPAGAARPVPARKAVVEPRGARREGRREGRAPNINQFKSILNIPY